MIHVVLTHLAAVIVGAILYKLFFVKIQQFEKSEIAKITSKIEALKATDLAAYTRLKNEWELFLGNDKAKIGSVSSELKLIVDQIRNK